MTTSVPNQPNPAPLAAAPAPAPLGRNGRTNAIPYYRPRSFLNSSGGNTNSRYGTEGPPRSGVGPIRSTGFGASPMINTTPGFMSNFYVPDAKLVKDYARREIMDGFQAGHLMITKKNTKPVVKARRGIKEKTRRYTMLNVVAWNYLQQLKEKMPHTMEDVKSPEEIWCKWYVEGVAKNEEGATTEGNKSEKGKERLINNIVRGSTDTFNGWGNNIGAKTRLWLILKKPDHSLKGHYTLSPYGMESVNVKYTSRSYSKEQPLVGGIGRDLTDRPYQLYFWAEAGLDEPPDCALEFLDEFGVKRRGLAIYVGLVERGRYNQTQIEKALLSVSYNLATLTTQPKIFVFVDPDHLPST